MASHHHLHHPYPHHHQPSPPPSRCCCNPSYSNCCTTTPAPHHPSPPPPPPQHDHLVQAIVSLLISQPHLIPTQSHSRDNLNLNPHGHHLQHQHQTHSTISSLIHRIESLESSLNHLHTHQSLRHAAARVIQTHFRSFLVRRSRTLSHLKHLASIKSSFNALKSSFSSQTHFDFSALSFKAMNLLLKLDSIEDCDSMIVDGKRSISKDLVQFLDSIEEVAVKKHLHCVKVAKNPRYGQKVQKPRNVGDDEKRKLLQNLRGRVERISRLCEPSANGEDLEPEEEIYDHDHDEDGVTDVLMSRRGEVSPNKNGVFVQRQGVVQPRVKKSVRFAENGDTFEVYNSSTCEPDLNGDVTCSEGSSSGDDQVEVLENVSSAVEDVVDSSQGAENDDSGGSPHSSDDGEKNLRRGLRNDGRIVVEERLQGNQGKLLFSAPLPLKMENRTDSKKSKGVKILT